MDINFQCEYSIVHDRIIRRLKVLNDAAGGAFSANYLSQFLLSKIQSNTKPSFWSMFTKNVDTTMTLEWGGVTRTTSFRRKFGEYEKNTLASAQLVYTTLNETRLSLLCCLAMELPNRKVKHLTVPNAGLRRPLIVHVKPFKSSSTGLIHYRLTYMDDTCNVFLSVLDGFDEVEEFVTHPTVLYVDRENLE